MGSLGTEMRLLRCCSKAKRKVGRYLRGTYVAQKTWLPFPCKSVGTGGAKLLEAKPQYGTA